MVKQIAISALGAATCFYGLFHFNVYLPGQTVNGVDVSCKTPNAAIAKYRQVADSTLRIELGDTEITIPNSAEIMLNKTLLRQDFTDWIKRNPKDITVNYNFDDKLIYSKLSDIVAPVRDAYISYDVESGYVLHEESYGCEFDVSKAISRIKESTSLTVDLSNLLNKPEIVVDDVIDQYNKVAWLNDFTVTYDCGLVIDKTLLHDFVDDEYNFNPDMDAILQLVKDAYDVTETSRKFTTHSGTSIDVPFKTFGLTLDTKKETRVLQHALETHESITRSPEISGWNTFGDTYVEVSIADQHLWFYKDGELFSETNIVSGRKGVHDTPTGLFCVTERVPGKILRGPGYASHVNYWMRLNNAGVGLHDATWRSSFGSNIYTYNGSHGCINLPKSFAKELYGESFVGMPVVVY